MRDMRELRWSAFRYLEKGAFCAVIGFFSWGAYQHMSAAYWDSGRLVEMKRVYIEGDTTFSSLAAAERRLQRAVADGLFNADLTELEEELRTDVWVSRAFAELVWPAGLRVRLFEHKVIAYWGEDALLSDAGVVFEPESVPAEIAERSLPTLSGNAERSREVLALYLDLQAVLARLGRRITRLEENDHRSVDLHLDNGVHIAVGGKDQLARIRRMAEVYPVFFASGRRKPEYIDLRYPTSVAVRYTKEEGA